MAPDFVTRNLSRVAAVILLVGCAGTTNGQDAAEQSTEPVAEPAPTVAATTEPITSIAPTDPVGNDQERVVDPNPIDLEVSCTACESQARTITIGGKGEDFGPPDRGIVDIGVSARRPTVAEATRQASAAGAAMIAALLEAGVPAEGIQTSRFSINPQHAQYDYTQVIGYENEISYRVTVPDVNQLGAVLGRAIDAGGDTVRAWSVGFAGEPSEHMAVARAEAWDDVRRRAEATAEEIGAPLGEVLDVHEKVLVTSPQGMMQGGEGDTASFDIPISPGVVGVIVLLTVTYAIGM